jgi:hypothetical protein
MKRKDQRLLDDIFLQPWYLPLKTCIAIRNLLPSQQYYKMKFYFEDYGCMICAKKRVKYEANGMCKPCHQRVKLRILFAIKRRWTAKSAMNEPRTFTRIGDAQRILQDLLRQARSSN